MRDAGATARGVLARWHAPGDARRARGRGRGGAPRGKHAPAPRNPGASHLRPRSRAEKREDPRRRTQGAANPVARASRGRARSHARSSFNVVPRTCRLRGDEVAEMLRRRSARGTHSRGQCCQNVGHGTPPGGRGQPSVASRHARIENARPTRLNGTPSPSPFSDRDVNGDDRVAAGSPRTVLSTGSTDGSPGSQRLPSMT